MSTGRPRGRPRKHPLPPAEPVAEPLTILTPEEHAGMDTQWGQPDPPKPKPTPKPRAVTLPTPVIPSQVVPQKALGRRAQTVGEFFTRLMKMPDLTEQIAWLRYNDKPVYRYLLRLGFADVVWKLPKGLPPYTPYTYKRHGKIIPLKPGMAPTELLHEARRLHVFLEGGAEDMARTKREKVFQDMIEGMSAEEVDILLSLKDKKLSKFVDKTVVAQAFPGLFDTPFNIRFLR